MFRSLRSPMRAAILSVAAMALGPLAVAKGPDPAALDAALSASLKAGAPGAVLMVEGQGATYLKAQGFADRIAKTAMPTDDALRIGSISKLYVAAVIHSLADDGVLDIASPIARYLPGDVVKRVANAQTATLAQLLNHTSGAPDYYTKAYVKSGAWRRASDLGLIIDTVAALKPTHPPGARYAYSNTNYQLLALAAENATGKSLAVLMQERIFMPLGLVQTRYNVGHPGGVIRGYGSPKAAWDDTWDSSENSGADGGITAPAHELAIFLRALFAPNGRLTAIGAAMQTQTVAKHEAELSGLGAQIRTARNGMVFVGHTGEVYGYISAAYYVPEKDTVVIAHVNREHAKALIALLSGVSQAMVAAKP